MPVLYHTEGFQTALRLFRYGAERLKGINGRFQHHLIIVHNQNINGIEFHLFPLSVGYGNIQNNGKLRSLALFTDTVNRSFHQFDHLLCNGQTETGSLNTVDTAVYLS